MNQTDYRQANGSARSRSRAARRRGGRTLVEMLMATLISLFLGTALLMLIQSTMTARTSVTDGNAATRDVRQCMNTIGNNIRNAQMYSTNGVFSTASTSSVTCYTNTTGTTTARYWLDSTVTPKAFKQTVGGVTTTLLTDVTSVSFTYYVDPSSTNFTSPSTWSTTADSHNPTAAEIPTIGAVGITVTVTNGTVTRSLTSLVRLRNSPTRTHI
ncbi:MAG TPA: hypothetical protein VKT77_05885 [Chthonomonadaceae bacterium]|nr:hypothetical protein [Chthonomonadaceae bacterium]